MIRAIVLGLFVGVVAQFAFGSQASAQWCPRGYNLDAYGRCYPAYLENYGGAPAYRGGRCPNGYDWTPQGCVPNQPNYYRRGYKRGYQRGGRCPNGYDWTPNGCVPNR